MKAITLAVKVGELQQKVKEQAEQIATLVSLCKEFADMHKEHIEHQHWAKEFADAVVDDMKTINNNFKRL